MNTKNTPALELRSFYVARKRVHPPTFTLDPRTGEVLDKSLTKQEHLLSCDINNIIKDFSKTGQIHHISANAAKGAYMDLPEELDYQAALNTVIDAENAFATLPSKVRDRFGNDPAEFLAFMGDPQNLSEARELGLLKPATPVPAPTPTPTPSPEKPA